MTVPDRFLTRNSFFRRVASHSRMVSQPPAVPPLSSLPARSNAFPTGWAHFFFLATCAASDVCATLDISVLDPRPIERLKLFGSPSPFTSGPPLETALRFVLSVLTVAKPDSLASWLQEDAVNRNS